MKCHDGDIVIIVDDGADDVDEDDVIEYRDLLRFIKNAKLKKSVAANTFKLL